MKPRLQTLVTLHYLYPSTNTAAICAVAAAANDDDYYELQTMDYELQNTDT